MQSNFHHQSSPSPALAAFHPPFPSLLTGRRGGLGPSSPLGALGERAAAAAGAAAGRGGASDPFGAGDGGGRWTKGLKTKRPREGVGGFFVEFKGLKKREGGSPKGDLFAQTPTRDPHPPVFLKVF